jgi:hypothetical protein
MNKLISKLFEAPKSTSGGSIIGWWEIRRIPYNLIVGLFGIICLLLFFFFITKSEYLQPGEDAIEPIGLIAAPIFINIAYTGGWIGDLFIRLFWRNATGQLSSVLLKVGVGFSLLMISFPAIFWGVKYIQTLPK